MMRAGEEPFLMIAIDQSTASTKGFLFDAGSGRSLAEYSLPHRQYYPKPGWVEHDPEEIFRNTREIIRFLVAKAGHQAENINGISITNQRETVVIWDKKTGDPLYRAIVWQCLRGDEICKEIKVKCYEDVIREKTGLIVDPYFSASKIKWVLDNVLKNYSSDRIAVGTVDSWLIWRLTSGVHVTDYSNACRTMLFNIKRLDWDEELLELFNIPGSAMPKTLPSDSIFGHTDCDRILKHEVPICGVMGDSQAALFGQGCFNKGMTKATYGTGSSIMMNVGNEPIHPLKGIVTSIGWGIRDEVVYVIEGNVHATGAAIKWLADNLGLLSNLDEVESICSSLEDTEGVYFVPAFSGLGAPYWESKARGLIYGLTFKASKAHLIRAAVEAIAYQIRDVVEVLEDIAGAKISELKADGGASKNNFLMQFQADILGVPVIRSGIEDMSAFGAFLMGCLGLNILKNFNEVSKLISAIPKDVFLPKMPALTRENKYSMWKQIINRLVMASSGDSGY